MNVKRKCTWLVLALCALAAIGGVVFAGVSAEEAAKLGTSGTPLTPMGSERAGNKEGTIPEWTGGLTSLPPGVKDHFHDLYPNEKPLFSITAKNMDQYADKLSVGTKALLKKWPTFRLDVYPTHRTFAGPDYYYEASIKNATRAKTTDGGNTVEGAIIGVPFPIPKTALEVQWNHQCRWQGGAALDWTVTSYVLPLTGSKINTGTYVAKFDSPYGYKGMTPEKLKKAYRNAYSVVNTYMVGPPDQVGSITGGDMILDPGHTKSVVYQYLVGQRRVRRAPNVAYDAPNPGNSGSTLVDEAWLWTQDPSKYNWKIIGKKEMYIPYNCNKTRTAPVDTFLKPHHYNPDYVRWELHRVWVIEANLKPGDRHIEPRRTFYADEDSWIFALEDMYDAQGVLWKVGIANPWSQPEIPATFIGQYAVYNLLTGSWAPQEIPLPGKDWKMAKPRPASFYSAEGIASQGIR